MSFRTGNGLAGCVGFACAITAAVGGSIATGAEDGIARQPAAAVVVAPGRVIRTRLFADGRTVDVPSQTVWRPICGSDPAALDAVQLAELARRWDGAATAQQIAADGAPPAQFDLAFHITTSVPSGAQEAIDAVERYLESQFSDPTTLVVDLKFSALPPGVLGATSVAFMSLAWSDVRSGLIGYMDSNDVIQSFLPSGLTIPVRYNATTATVTNEAVAYLTAGNFAAAIGAFKGPAATIVINSEFPWDYTPPSINSGSYSFQDVLLHEIGHAMGFTSAVDLRIGDIEGMDAFRFQMSDGAGNYNPDTTADFTTSPRLVDRDPPPPNDDNDAVCDILSAEYRMADGVPSQGSHFAPMNPGINLMDPSFAATETFYPDFYRNGDLDMLDAIGWDYPPTNTSCPEAAELTCGRTRHFDNSVLGGVPAPAYSCGLGGAHEGTMWFRFTAEKEWAHISTCGSPGGNSTIAVYDGNCGGLAVLGCSEDDDCGAGSGLSSICLTDLTPGMTYYVQVSAASTSDRGIYSLQLICDCDAACADVCCVQAATPSPEPNAQPQNRYLAFTPGNAGRRTAFRVKLAGLQHPFPANSPSSPPLDYSSFEGQSRWIGPPGVYNGNASGTSQFFGSVLQCSPFSHDWAGIELLQVTGEAIMPSSWYEVEALDEGCLNAFGGASGFSAPLTLTTARWGDIAPGYQDPLAPYPPTQPNVLDIAGVVDHVRGTGGALRKPQVQIQPNTVNPAVNLNVLDAATAVDAVKGAAYRFAGPSNCP